MNSVECFHFFSMSCTILKKIIVLIFFFTCYLSVSNCNRLIFGEGVCSELVVDNFNPIALRTAKIVYNFGCSECNRVKRLDQKVIFIQ